MWAPALTPPHEIPGRIVPPGRSLFPPPAMPASPANRAVSCLLAPAGDEDSVRRAAGECRELLGANPDLVIVFACSDHCPLRRGIQGPPRGFNTRFPGTPAIGGMISGGPSEEDLVLFDDRRPLDAGFVAIGFGANVRIEPIVAQNCRPIGEPLVMTGSRAKARRVEGVAFG
jgi:hypothetical protein